MFMFFTLNRSVFVIALIALMACHAKKDKGFLLAAKRPGPNVILILADDQGWGDLGMHQNPYVKTPVLDRIARDGARFEHFYVSPLCAPTRASLLTGRYYLRTGTSWVSKGLENMNPEEQTFAEIFKANGYRTGCFGKWHNGAHYPQHPNRQGFDEFVGFCAGHWNNYFGTTLEHNGKPFPTNGYITNVLTSEAIKFIETNKDRPFFCYVPYNVPHSPFQVPNKYFDKYKSLGLSDKNAAVYGMCENMDMNVGRIFDKVDSLGLADNTLIIFLSDNGPNGHRYNGGMKGIKGSVDEGGVRVPCFAYWKGKIKPSTRIADLASHIDWLPTLVSMCRLEVPGDLYWDGVDLSDLILGRSDSLPDRLLFSKLSRSRITPEGAVRSEEYRLVMVQSDTALYDMGTDPGQKTDISGDHPALTLALAGAYNRWFEEVMSEYHPQNVIQVGFNEESETYLPAHESVFSGALHFKEGHGWAHDWLINWTQPMDSIYWEMEVVESADFDIFIRYSCPEADTGAKIIVRNSNDRSEQVISKSWDPTYIPSPDRVKRVEVYEKEWARQKLGTLHFKKGRQYVSLKADAIPGKQVCEVKGIYLEKN